MISEFHELNGFEELRDCGALGLERARKICEAVRRQRDFSLVQLLAKRHEGRSTTELLVVDVECHGVPPNNTPGILFSERLALSVPADPTQLVCVLALRVGFPVLIHQNQGPTSGPASLCLYFEPPASVLRTWTPQRFLRRIQWWLEQSAKGEIHPADQPVEHLFFMSRYELVLPWNFDELRRRPDQRFVVRSAGSRPDGGETYLVLPDTGTGGSQEGTIASIELTLPPIVHGHIERDPTTLGELADTLLARGVDMLSGLQHALVQRVDENGASQAEGVAFTVIILHVPIIRHVGADPEGVACRAFLLRIGPLQLGESVGALVQFGNKYYRESGLGERQYGSWKAEPLWPMEVLRFNDSSKARAQSGTLGPGPLGVLVGAGSLGSAMLDLWGRSGWGQWTVIDRDHIRPHNLARHTAHAQHVGQPKADVVAQLHDAVVAGASRVTPVCADATRLSDARVRTALNAAALIVDASTTLEYPRLASATDDLGRHVSVFLTPSGNAAALLAEDTDRSVRLRTLEAQYYRAVVEEPWGDQHLAGHHHTFWSGASCRDISVVLPYSQVVVHAGLLAEQVQRAATRPDPTIRVWIREKDSGAVTTYEPQVSTERSVRVGDLDVFIDAGLEEKLHLLRRRGLPDETGGVLLGYHDFNLNALVLVDALPAPPDSETSSAFFERGVQGLTATVNEAVRRTVGIVGYVGEWHSHPQGCSSTPSGRDLYQLVYLTLGMADDGVPAVSVIVSETDVQIIAGVVRP